MIVREGNFADPKVLALVREHLHGMHASSPPGSVYALDLSGLQRADMMFCTVWSEDPDELLAMGALREIDVSTGEVKSMRTAQGYLRRGAAAFLLEYFVVMARERGYRRLCLETGSGPAFEAALALYRRFGFENGASFGDYEASAFNQFLHLQL